LREEERKEQKSKDWFESQEMEVLVIDQITFVVLKINLEINLFRQKKKKKKE